MPLATWLNFMLVIANHEAKECESSEGLSEPGEERRGASEGQEHSRGK